MVFGRQVICRRSERGAVAVTTALFLTGLFGFFALAFNVGLVMDSRGELQNGSDAAALAGARSLDGMASGLTAARDAAYAYSMAHRVYGERITIDTFASDLTFGRWHLRADECLFGSSGRDCFEALPTDEPRRITAVRIRNGRDGGSHNGPLPLFFGAFVGTETANVRSAAVATGVGSAAVKCMLPLAVAECRIVNGSGQMNCGPGTPQRMVFSDANADAVGFANLGPDEQQSPSGTFVAETINKRLCNPDKYKVGPARLHNGNDFGKVIDALRGVDHAGNLTSSCLIGQTLSWAVTDAGCPGNPIFQGVQEVVGFVKVTVVAVTDNRGDSLGCPGGPAPAVVGSPRNAVIVDIPCAAPTDGSDLGGGRVYNATGVRTRLVQ